MRPPVYDWHRIEQEFIHDNVPLHNGVTLKTIAEKYGIPYQTVRRKAAADKWHSNRYHCYRMKMGYDREFYDRIDKEIERVERRNAEANTVQPLQRCATSGRFLPGNQVAVGNRGNTRPKWGNKNAMKHGAYAGGFAKVHSDGSLYVFVSARRWIKVGPEGYRRDPDGRIAVRDDVAEILEENGFELSYKWWVYEGVNVTI